jgi:hypothetical protein
VNVPARTRRSSLVPIPLRGQTTPASAIALLVMAGVTTLILIAGILHRPTLPTPIGWPMYLVVIGFVLVGRFSINEQIGSTQVVLMAIELPLVLGMFSIAPARVVGSCLIGMALSWFLQGRKPLFRFLTNFVLCVFEVTMTVAVFHAFSPNSDIRYTSTWLIAFSSVLSARLIRTILELGIVRLSGAEFSKANALGTIAITGAASVCMTSLGIVAVIVATQSRLAELLVVAVVAGDCLSGLCRAS